MRCTSPYIQLLRSGSGHSAHVQAPCSTRSPTSRASFKNAPSSPRQSGASLVQNTHRLKENCEWLEQQVKSTQREYEKIIFVLSSAHSKATLDRRNRPCEGCLSIFREVYLAPCFHLVCRACYPDPGEELCKACRAEHQGISAAGGLPHLAI
jgi:hypothetical protein